MRKFILMLLIVAVSQVEASAPQVESDLEWLRAQKGLSAQNSPIIAQSIPNLYHKHPGKTGRQMKRLMRQGPIVSLNALTVLKQLYGRDKKTFRRAQEMWRDRPVEVINLWRDHNAEMQDPAAFQLFSQAMEYAMLPTHMPQNKGSSHPKDREAFKLWMKLPAATLLVSRDCFTKNLREFLVCNPDLALEALALLSCKDEAFQQTIFDTLYEHAKNKLPFAKALFNGNIPYMRTQKPAFYEKLAQDLWLRHKVATTLVVWDFMDQVMTPKPPANKDDDGDGNGAHAQREAFLKSVATLWLPDHKVNTAQSLNENLLSLAKAFCTKTDWHALDALEFLTKLLKTDHVQAWPKDDIETIENFLIRNESVPAFARQTLLKKMLKTPLEPLTQRFKGLCHLHPNNDYLKYCHLTALIAHHQSNHAQTHMLYPLYLQLKALQAKNPDFTALVKMPTLPHATSLGSQKKTTDAIYGIHHNKHAAFGQFYTLYACDKSTGVPLWSISLDSPHFAATDQLIFIYKSHTHEICSLNKDTGEEKTTVRLKHAKKDLVDLIATPDNRCISVWEEADNTGPHLSIYVEQKRSPYTFPLNGGAYENLTIQGKYAFISLSSRHFKNLYVMASDMWRGFATLTNIDSWVMVDDHVLTLRNDYSSPTRLREYNAVDGEATRTWELPFLLRNSTLLTTPTRDRFFISTPEGIMGVAADAQEIWARSSSLRRLSNWFSGWQHILWARTFSNDDSATLRWADGQASPTLSIGQQLINPETGAVIPRS